MYTFQPSNITTKSVSQKDPKKKKGPTCTKIFLASFCGVKELEIEAMSISWGMAEQIVVYDSDGIPLCYRER